MTVTTASFKPELLAWTSLTCRSSWCFELPEHERYRYYEKLVTKPCRAQSLHRTRIGGAERWAVTRRPSGGDPCCCRASAALGTRYRMPSAVRNTAMSQGTCTEGFLRYIRSSSEPAPTVMSKTHGPVDEDVAASDPPPKRGRREGRYDGPDGE